MLVSDLDGTLLGDNTALAEFAAWRRTHADVLLVYSSGRLFRSVVQSVSDSLLPEPDLIISGVGTEIHDYRTGCRWHDWPTDLSRWNAALIQDHLADRSDLELQPEEFLSERKVSYFAHEWTSGQLHSLHEDLLAINIHCRLVYSSRRDLDLLPDSAGKGNAAVFVAERMGLSRRHIIAAGDSGNDLCMLTSAGRSIIVGNAQDDLMALNDPHIFRATHHYAAGVLEGLNHWWPAE